MKLKAIQIVDEAWNCTFPLYGVTETELRALFGKGRDIAFIDEVNRRLGRRARTILSRVWQRPILKRKARGIHGTLFYVQHEDHVERAKRNWPTRRECEVDPRSIPEPMRIVFSQDRKRRGLTEQVDYPPFPLNDLPSERKRRNRAQSSQERRRGSR